MVRPAAARDSSAIWRRERLFRSRENKLSSSCMERAVRVVRLTWRGKREDEEVKDAWPGLD